MQKWKFYFSITKPCRYQLEVTVFHQERLLYCAQSLYPLARHFRFIKRSIFVPPAALANEDIKEEEKSFKGQHEGPFINPELSPNVTGVLGKEVRLACHVEHLANKTVSRSFHEIKPSLPPCTKNLSIFSLVVNWFWPQILNIPM